MENKTCSTRLKLFAVRVVEIIKNSGVGQTEKSREKKECCIFQTDPELASKK
jgi:hypothetical protein